MKKILITLMVFFCCTKCVSAQNPGWWEKYNDPLLVGYINEAVASNYDYKDASLKIKESRARVREFFGKELPKLSVFTNYVGIKPPLFANDPQAVKKFENLFILPLLATYEVDIWGKNRGNTKIQKEQLEEIKQDARAVYIALEADVASAYFNILQFDKLIELQNAIIQSDFQNLDIIKSKYEIGLVSYDELLTAESVLAQSQIQLNDLLKQRDFFLNELMVLTGKSPENDEKQSLARTSLDNVSLPEDTPLEIPANSVMQRPDILKSEARLRESKINIDLARKKFLPDINIFGVLGFESIDISDLVDISELLTGFGGLVAEDLFTGGQRRAALKQRKYQYEQLLQNYQSTILTALKETNNALYALKTDLKNNECNLARVQLQSDSYNLVNVRYEKGLASCLDTIQPQIDLFVIQQEQIRTKTSYLIGSINLYKALGGKI